MCGRFTLIMGPDGLKLVFGNFEFPIPFAPRYNIAPGQDVLVLPNDGERSARSFRWGLVPSWAKDPKIGNRLINARAETLEQKPAFQMAYEKRRCLILGDGFYEWRKESGGNPKTPIYIRLKSGKPFAFAGLWESYRTGDGNILHSCVIITTEPNDLLKEIHNRMPAILEADSYEQWLDPDYYRPEGLRGLLKPYPSEKLRTHPVSRQVNDFKHDTPGNIEPLRLVETPPQGFQESLPI